MILFLTVIITITIFTLTFQKSIKTYTVTPSLIMSISMTLLVDTILLIVFFPALFKYILLMLLTFIISFFAYLIVLKRKSSIDDIIYIKFYESEFIHQLMIGLQIMIVAIITLMVLPPLAWWIQIIINLSAHLLFYGIRKYNNVLIFTTFRIMMIIFVIFFFMNEPYFRNSTKYIYPSNYGYFTSGVNLRPEFLNGLYLPDNYKSVVIGTRLKAEKSYQVPDNLYVQSHYMYEDHLYICAQDTDTDNNNLYKFEDNKFKLLKQDLTVFSGQYYETDDYLYIMANDGLYAVKVNSVYTLISFEDSNVSQVIYESGQQLIYDIHDHTFLLNGINLTETSSIESIYEDTYEFLSYNGVIYFYKNYNHYDANLDLIDGDYRDDYIKKVLGRDVSFYGYYYTIDNNHHIYSTSRFINNPQAQEDQLVLEVLDNGNVYIRTYSFFDHTFSQNLFIDYQLFFIYLSTLFFCFKYTHKDFKKEKMHFV